MLNEFQKTVAHVYGGGDFAHITSMNEVNDCGDTLFKFLMIELSNEEDCEDRDTAIRRVWSAIYDLQQVLEVLNGE